MILKPNSTDCTLLLIAGQLRGLAEFNTFTVKVYIKNWFQCTSAANAPVNDLKLLADLKNYREINAPIANESLRTFRRHFWYLSDNLLGLSFFDQRHDAAALMKMAAALKNAGDARNKFRNVSLNTDSEDDSQLHVSDLISSNTLKFFDIVGNGEIGFLANHPSVWERDQSYVRMAGIVKNLNVVNDPAERAIGLIKTVNNTLTKDSTQQGHLLQVIESHNRKHPDKNKSTIVSNLQG